MNVAYLDPPYSRYFHKLSASLCQRTGGATLALLSSPAYCMYARGDRQVLWHPGEADRAYTVPVAFERAAWAKTDSALFNRTFSHAVAWFKAQFTAAQTDVCLLFSDARPFSVAAHLAAQEVGVVCLFFERGAFRDRTSSLSTQGLNARFKLGSAGMSPRIVGLPEAELPARRPVEPWLRTRFVGFMLQNALACCISPARDLMQHKRYHFFNYVRIAWKQFTTARQQRRRHADAHADAHADVHAEPQDRHAPVILLPLQLQTDSQFVMHSPFRHNQELLDFVVPGLLQQMPNAVVLVKKHPMDVRSYRLPPRSRFVEGNLARFIPRAALMVCINSTVGFEAAIHGKTVLCFGESFYTEHSRVIRVTKVDFLAQVKAARARRDNPDDGRSLKSAILRYYQSPGDVWAYTDKDIVAATGIVIEHVRDAREHMARAATAAAGRPRIALPAGMQHRTAA